MGPAGRKAIGDEPEARAEDVATLDVLRLLTFAVTAGAAEINAGAVGRSRRVSTSGSPAPGCVYQVLLRLEKARAAAAVDDFDGVFATLREAGLLSGIFRGHPCGAWSMRPPPAGTSKRARHVRLRN